MIRLTRRNYIRLISYSVLALIVLFSFAIMGAKSTMKYQNQLEISYQQSLTELNECLDSISTDLTKSLYSNSYGEIYDLSRDMYAQCATAKNAISRLPVSQMELANSYKFLSQASDYAQYLGAKIENGEKLNADEHKNLKSLLGYAQKFADKTNNMVDIVEAGGKITSNDVKSGSEISVSTLSNDFSKSAKTFDDFPTLLYDGPFSDQVLKKTSTMLRKAKIINKNDCKKIAAKALDVNVNKISYESDEQWLMPCYTFNSGRYTISITKQGGYVREILYSGTADVQSISASNACNLALEYLKDIGYKDMVISYYEISNNICTVNCAYKKRDVICYADLIKVGVSMDDGRIVTLDATTFLTNHTDRKIKKPKLSTDDAKARLSKYLIPSNVKQCIIPKESGKEVQCYEISCTSKDTGEKALVYINIENGNEEDIMLLMETDNGTLVK